MYGDSRRFASFFFGWDLDVERTRLVFFTVLDIDGRNIKPFGKSLRRYNRWVEEGFENELMRWTDYANSLPSYRRQQLSGLSRLSPMRPSEPLLNDLWDLAKGRMRVEDFLRKHSSFSP